MKFVLKAFVAGMTFNGGPLTVRVGDCTVRLCSSRSVFDTKPADQSVEGPLFVIPSPRGPTGEILASTSRDVGLSSEDILSMPRAEAWRIEPSEFDPKVLERMSLIWNELEKLSYRIAGLLRWRFFVPMATGQFEAIYRLIVPTERECIHVGPVATICSNLVFRLGQDNGLDFEKLIEIGAEEPLSNDFLWEARHLLARRHFRGALVMAINAAEICVKSHIIKKVPSASWLVMNLPSPPLHKLCKDYLPLLASEGSGEQLSKEVVKALHWAVEKRNRVVHVGEDVSNDEARKVLDCVAKLLHHVDAIDGFVWSLKLSDEDHMLPNVVWKRTT